MHIFNIIRINLDKLKVQKTKALFLILPIGLLVTLTVIIVSQLQNIQNGIDKSVFETLQNQATLLQIQKSNSLGNNVNNRGGAGGLSGTGSFQQINFDNNFSENDLAIIQKMANVQSASLNTSVPISNAVTTDLFADTTYKLNSIRELDATSAQLFTNEDFNYKQEEPIPIILNSNSFFETYEDWGGQTSISFDFQNFTPTLGENGKPVSIPSPIKTEAIEYDKNSLIGKTFTINFGGMDPIDRYAIEQSGTVRTFRKLTDAEYQTKLNEREAAIAPYWNYGKLSETLEYTFKVVGVTTTGDSAYIPTAFANKLMEDYFQNAMAAWKADPPKDELDRTFLGLSFDGNELSGGTGFGFSRSLPIKVDLPRGGMFSIGGGPRSITVDNTPKNSYNIPGLIIKTGGDGSSTVEGVYHYTDVYDRSVKSSPYITIKVDSVYNRSEVVEALNTAGYAVQDVNNFAIFNQIQSTLQTVSFGFTVGFITLTVVVILFTMMKFVSDSRKEIGIFRAMGMKKLTVLILFTSQALLYTVVAGLIGLGAGIALHLASSVVVSGAFSKFINDTIQQTFNVIVETDKSIFSQIDVRTIGIYCAILMGLAFVISLIPAYMASRVSPIEAIRGE